MTLKTHIADQATGRTAIVLPDGELSVKGTPTTDFMIEVAKGNVPGHSAINKFGHNPAAVSGNDIWGGGGTYLFFPLSAVACSIVSTDNVEDNVGGDGALQVIIEGETTGFISASETITLTGTTPVVLSNTYMRLFRAFVYEAGANNTNAGAITVYETATPANIGIHIGIGHGQTQQAIYTIPDGKTGYFVKGYVGLKNSTFQGEDGVFRWLMKLNDGVVNGAWLVQGEVGLINIGSSYWQYKYGIPAGPLPEHTDIRIELTDASDTMDTVAGYDMLLVDDGF